MTIENPTTSRSGRRVLVGLVLVALVAVGGFAWHARHSTYHLAVVQEGVLYRDGARSSRELKIALDQAHPKTVVCLVDDQEMSDPAKPQFAQEMTLLQARGIRIERIPVKLGGWPTSEDVRRFLNVASDPGSRPVLVHCAQGVRRTAMMVAAYQRSVLGYDKEKAKAAILTFGHSDRTIDDIRRFIDGYDADTRTAPAEVAQAKPAQ